MWPPAPARGLRGVCHLILPLLEEILAALSQAVRDTENAASPWALAVTGSSTSYWGHNITDEMFCFSLGCRQYWMGGQKCFFLSHRLRDTHKYCHFIMEPNASENHERTGENNPSAFGFLSGKTRV